MHHVLQNISFLLVLTLLYSCVQEEISKESKKDNEDVLLYIQSSGPSSYAMSETTESSITTIDFLAFKLKDGTETYAYRREVDIITTDPLDITKKTFKVSLVKDGYHYNYVIIANGRTEINNFFKNPISSTSVTRDGILSRIVTDFEDKWSDTKVIPMYGESKNKYPEELNGNTIYLMRSLARVDVFHPTGIDFELKEVYVYNRFRYGLITPYTRETSWSATYQPPSIPGSPYIATIKRQYPTSTGAKTDPARLIPYGGWNGSNTSDFETFTESGEKRKGLRRVIYLHESDIPANDNHLEATCLVVGGEYNGVMTYYRIDILHPSSDAGKYNPVNNGFYMGGQIKGTQYRPLIRNTNYTINIIKVSGPGYPTSDEAFEAAETGSENNITVEIIPWNESAPITPPNPSEYVLNISPTSNLTIRGTNSYHGMVTIQTDYPGGWRVSSVTGGVTYIESAGKLEFTVPASATDALYIIDIKAGPVIKRINITRKKDII